MRLAIRLAALCLAAAFGRVAAQTVNCAPTDTLTSGRPAPRITHRLRTNDGSVFLGCLVAQGTDTLKFETSGGLLALPASAVAELTPVAARDLHDGQYWFPNPNATRLFFAPTGRMLHQGEGYYSNTYLIFNGLYGGLSDRFSLGGSVSLIPSSSDQLLFVTPKLGVIADDQLNVAVGALLGYNGFGNGDVVEPGGHEDHQFGIVYSVATVGSLDNNVTGGIGWGYNGSGLLHTPALMLGGMARVSPRTALVTENYFVNPISASGTFFSYGVRFFGEKLSVDLALVNAAKDAIFPGVPWVSFAVKF